MDALAWRVSAPVAPSRRPPSLRESHWGRLAALGQVSPHWGRLFTYPNAPFPTPIGHYLPQCGRAPAHGRWRTGTQGHAPTLHNHRTSPAAPGQPASSAPPATWAPSKPVRTPTAAHPIAAATDTTPVPTPGWPRQPPTLSMTGFTSAPAHARAHPRPRLPGSRARAASSSRTPRPHPPLPGLLRTRR